MEWVVLGTVSGAAIGCLCTRYYMLHWREKYLVCKTERRNTEVMLRQVTPHRVRGRFARKAA